MKTRHAEAKARVGGPQRYTWKTVATYDDHDSAVLDVAARPAVCKIKRRGDRFEVRVGTPVRGDK